MSPINLSTAASIAEPGASHNTTRDIFDVIDSDDLEEVISLTDTFNPTQERLTLCLGSACRMNHPQIARYLLSKGARISDLAIYAACFRGKSIGIFEVLVDHGWDINRLVGSRPAL